MLAPLASGGSERREGVFAMSKRVGWGAGRRGQTDVVGCGVRRTEARAKEPAGCRRSELLWPFAGPLVGL